MQTENMMVVVIAVVGSRTSSQYQIQNKLGGFWHNLQIPTKYLCREEKCGQIQHFIGDRNDTPHLIWGETWFECFTHVGHPIHSLSEYKIGRGDCLYIDANSVFWSGICTPSSTTARCWTTWWGRTTSAGCWPWAAGSPWLGTDQIMMMIVMMSW